MLGFLPLISLRPSIQLITSLYLTSLGNCLSIPTLDCYYFVLFSSQQRVIPDGNMIPFLPINRDIHQGTILGPIRFSLSNDPGKKGSNFFYCGAIRFPQIEMFSFLRRECINLQKRSLRKKMYLSSRPNSPRSGKHTKLDPE